MNQSLSSAWTFVVKYLFPAVWIPAFGAGALLALQHPEDVMYNGVRGAAPSQIGWIFLLLWLAGTTVILWMSVPLKRVRVDSGALVVSNYFREWRVPFDLVTDVTQNRWVNGRPITVRLRADMGCGYRIVFLPQARLRWRTWREDPEVNELRRLAGLRVQP